MSDPLRDVKPGDPLGPLLGVSRYNLLNETARWYRRQAQGEGGAGPMDPLRIEHRLEVWIYSSSELPNYAVVALSSGKIPATTEPVRAFNSPVWQASPPSSEDDLVAIVTEGHPGGPDNLVRRAVIMGVAVVEVQHASESHKFARPIVGSMARLMSAETGPISLLPEYPPEGTPDAIRKRLVLLQGLGSGGGGDDPGDGGPCEGHGWLSDRDGLIARAGNTPEGILAVRVRAGEPGGNCECIVAQPATDEEAPLHAFYEGGGVDAWRVSEVIQTCCGCAMLELDVIGDESFPRLVGTLYINNTCDPGGAGTYPLHFNCASDDGARFSAAGPLLCDSGYTPQVPCKHHFYIDVTCEDCTKPGPECDECVDLCAPAWLILPPTFTGAYTVYNRPGGGDWWLEFVSDSLGGPCLWRVICGAITITAEILRDGDDSVIRVTYTGGPGTVVYEYVEVGQNIRCFDPAHTASVVSGDTADTPNTIAVDRHWCVTCPEKCGSVGFTEMFATVIDTSGSCGNLSLSQTGSVDNLPDGWSAAFDTVFVVPGGTDRSGSHELTCELGRVTLEFLSSGGPAFSWSYAVVSLEWEPFEFVVDITFSQEGCSSVYRVVFLDDL